MSFEPTDYSGIMWTLGGIVLLVFCGIAVSVLSDTSFSKSSSKIELSQTIDKERTHLDDLKVAIRSGERRWEYDYEPYLDHGKRYAALKEQSGRQGLKLDELRKTRLAFEDEVDELQAKFDDYRRRYRLQVRSSFVGERTNRLQLAGGRSYQEVTVRGYHETGLRIQHSRGTASVSYADLPASWQKRLHWDPSEALSKPRVADQPKPSSAKPKKQKPKPRAKPRSKPKPKPKVVKSTEDAEQEEENRAAIRKLQRRLRAVRRQYFDALGEARTARANAHRSQRSVPGSLETWTEKAERMEARARALRVDYFKTRSALQELAPKDPLLKLTLEEN